MGYLIGLKYLGFLLAFIINLYNITAKEGKINEREKQFSGRN